MRCVWKAPEHPSLPLLTYAESCEWNRMVERWRDAGVSARLAHCLAWAGCGTVEDTREMSEAEWLRQRQFGRVCMAELRALWERHGRPRVNSLILTYGEWRPGELP